MKTKIFPALTLLAVLLSAGCEKNSEEVPPTIVKGTGDLVEKTVEVDAFQRFRLTGLANVQIATGTEQSVVLKAQQEILDVMISKVSGNELVIGFQKNVQIDTDTDIYIGITVPLISQITVDGVGLFELSGDKQEELKIIVNGTCNISAYDMPVDNCEIVVSGTANCYVTVYNTLSVTIAGIGYIYYQGEPVISSSISGIGGVIDDNY